MSRARSTNRRVDILYGLPYAPDPRVHKTAGSLLDGDWEVRVVAWDRLGDRAIDDVDGTIPIRRLRIVTKDGRGPADLGAILRFAMALIPVLRRRRPAVIHAVDLPMLVVALAIRPFLLPARPRLVYDAFEIYARMVAHRASRPVLAAIEIGERWLPRLADLVVTPGLARQAYFAARGVPSVVVPNWRDPAIDLPDRAAARLALGLDERPSIVYVGLLGAARDLSALVDHAKRRPDHVVLIAGTGDAEHEVRANAEGLPNVRILGWVADPGMILAAADMVYYALKADHPYASLAAPNNLYTAIAHAVPLVYRPQGELAIVGGQHDVGEAFDDERTLDDAIDRLANPIRNAAVREVLRALRPAYTWSRAVRPLLDAYPTTGKAMRQPSTNGA